MAIIYFFYGLCFGGLGLTAYLQMRRDADLPLKKELPWLAFFGFINGAIGWVEMFMLSEMTSDIGRGLTILRMVLQPLSGSLILIFGWRVLTRLAPLPSWMIFVPGVLIVPIAYVITYAVTTFITPSPLDIPIDIWSRYLLYLPGAVMAGVGFLRQWQIQNKLGYPDISKMMLGAGLAFIFEAFIVGLVVPAAPYGPASYYNYDRVLETAFVAGEYITSQPYGLHGWLDYERVLSATGLPIQFWRLISAVVLTFFVSRGLDVFEAMSRRKVEVLTSERDRAQREAFQAQIVARHTAENWTELLVNISQRIAELNDVDKVLVYILENARVLLKSNYMAVAIVSEQFPCLELKYYSSDNKTEMVSSPLMVKNAQILDVLMTARSFRSTGDWQTERSGAGDQFTDVCPFDDRPAQNVAIAPVILDNNPIGVLWIARNSNEEYSETDLIWLECIADQVVIAIQHGLMTSQLQSLSVVEERARIAREMHDGLAQVLGYLNVQVQTLDALLKKQKWDKLAEEITRMRQAVQTAHADVRENILSLRTTLAHETGLVPAMLKYIEEFSFQTGIETHLENKAGEELELTSIAEVQLVCILQEALTNVRKHAQAKVVNVSLQKEKRVDEEFVHMGIQDDGVGFSLQKSARCFGLQTMRERAASVGGQMIIYSAAGQGTQLECRLPCLKPEQLRRKSIMLTTGMATGGPAEIQRTPKGEEGYL